MSYELPPPPPEIQQHLESPAYPPAEEKFVRFHERQVLDHEATQREKRPIYTPAEYVEIYTAGDKDNVVNRPVREFDKYVWPNRYVAFKRGQTQETGTPLSTWGGISEARVEELKYFKVHTVEQLAAIPDGQLGSHGPMARTEREKARNYLEAVKGSAPIAELRAENDSLKDRLSALEALMQQQAPRALDTAETLVEVNPEAKPKRNRKQVTE